MKWPNFRRPRLLVTGALLVPALLGSAALGLFWMLKQDSGTAWLLARVPGLQIEAPKGALLGDFSARQLVYTLPADGGRITLNGVVWRGSTFAWTRAPQFWGVLKLAYLHVDRVDIALKPSTEPAKAPTSLTLPLGVEVAQLEIDQINLPELGEQPLRQLKGSLVLSADRGEAHQLKLDTLLWDRLQISGAFQVATSAPMSVASRIALAPDSASAAGAAAGPLNDWRATVDLAGPLQELQVKAAVSSLGQRLNATARVQPFAPWPLAAFAADADQLDLSALASSLPRTALSGTAVLASSGWSEPARLAIQLSNAAAGRWDQRLLPVQRLNVELQGRPDQPRSLQLRGLDLLLGGPGAPAGRLTGDGQLAADESWRLTAQVSGLRPAALDARLAPLRLNGSITVTDTPKLPLQLSTKLTGDLLLPGQPLAPVQLSLQAQQEGQLVQINEALLSAGRSRLQLSGEASGNTSQWQLKIDAALKDFDPRLLWSGSAGSAAGASQRRPSSLNATLKAELQHAPSPAGQGFVLPLGEATLTVLPSQWVGMGLNGRLIYSRSAAKEAAAQAQLNVGDNQLQLQASVQGQTTVNTAVELKAPRLDAFAPVLALISPGTQLRGAAEGRVNALVQQGSNAAWQVSSDGNLNLQNLQLTPPTPQLPTRLTQAKLRWQADSRPDAPLALTAQLLGLAIGKQSASAINLDLQGSWVQHRLTASLQGKTSSEVSGSAQLALTGQLSNSPLQAWQELSTLNWRGRVTQLLARPSNPQLPDWLKVAEASPLDVQLQARANPGQTGLLTASVAPGRIELGGAQLRWSELQWAAPRNASEHAMVRAEIELEPLPVAPLLARWQPDFGWGGNLVVGGRASVRTVPELAIDMELLRQEGAQSGDLSVTDERGVQPLGLTDLRLTLNAHDGIWQFTQALAGTNLGTLGGSIMVNADPRALVPAPNAKLSGVLRANIANLGTWGGWVPAGWRLGGNVEASLQLGGTVGGPELTGQANGSAISVRNPLLGVDVTEGSFAMNLQGDNATLVSLSAKSAKGVNGSAGLLTASGQATLGEQPTAKLRVKAERFVLLNRVDRRLQASGNAELDLGAQSLQLIGKINIDEGLFDFSRGDAPTLDDDVLVLRPDTVTEPNALLDANGKPLPKPPSAAARKTVIELAIGLGNDLKLRGRGFDSRLRGDLKLAQTEGKLTLNGAVTTFRGTFEAYGQKLDIERGEITFAGPYDNPRLNVLAVRASNDDVRVGVSVLGTAISPRIKLFSEPEMSDTDKLSWLVLGRAPDGLGRADTALLQRAALALLSGEGESTSGKLIKNLGLDELSVQQNEDDTRGTVVRLGKQLSRRWFVGYERGLNATTGSWQLIYRIAQRFTLRAQSGDDNALELIWQWKWE